jgi:sulfate/thiosulfate transport system permease protein
VSRERRVASTRTGRAGRPPVGDSSERLQAIDIRRRPPGETGFTYYIPVGIVVLCLIPLLIMPIFAVFWFAFHAGPSRFIAALRMPEASFALRLSLMVALITSAINLVIGTLTAYVLSKYRFPGKRAFSIIVNLPVAIPTVVVGTSLLLLWGPIGLLGRFLEARFGVQPMFSAAGIILAHIFVTFPYMLGGVKPVLDEIEITYEEAAYTMGASRLKTFFYVILPALKGGLMAGTLLTFAHSLGEFGATVMVSGNLRLQTQTAPLYIFAMFESGRLESANAVAAVLALLSFVIFFAVVRFTERARESR